MAHRYGAVMDMKAVNKEVIGAIALVALLAILFNHFFSSGFGCYTNAQCQEAKAELQQLVKDANQACKNQLGGDSGISDLGEYDFVGSDMLAIRGNTFTLYKFEGNALEKAVNDVRSLDGLYDAFNPSDAPTEWQLQATAQDCNEVQQCQARDLMRVKEINCGEESPLDSWFFPIMGGSSGTVEYATFDSPTGSGVKLHWVGDNSMERWVRDAIDDAVSDVTGGSTATGTPTGSDVQTYGAMGGGSAYVEEASTAYSESNADMVVSSKSDLMDLESSASSGDTVFVPGDTTVTLDDDETIMVPDSVTLASNRGNGGDGALIEKPSASDEPAVEVGSNAKLTGFRVRGDDAGEHPNDRDTGGVGVDGQSDAEIVNNEITGFAKRCVIARDNTHVHHNVISYCNQYGYGYGVSVSGTNALIEYNRIDYYRHATASYAGQSYEARFNVIGPHRVNHDIDMHAEEGSGCENEHCGGEAGTMIVHHNTLTTTEETSETGQPVVNNRGVSPETTKICSNWVHYTQLDNPFWQMEEGRSSYENMVVSNNHIGTDDPGCSIGAPRESCPEINADGPGC